MIAQNNAGPFYPKIDLLVLPYMIQNYEHAVKVADGPVGQEIWGGMPKEVGVHLVTIPLFSFRHITTPSSRLTIWLILQIEIPCSKEYCDG